MKWTPGFAILAGLLLTTGAQAGEEGKTEGSAAAGAAAKSAPPASRPDDAAQAAPGIVVAIDPRTGQIRPPTAEERRALTESARRALDLTIRPTAIETFPDGRTRAILGPQFFRWSVVRRNADGNLVFDCVTKPEIPPTPAPAER
jgi:hypothetical protein